MELLWRRYFARGKGELPPEMLAAVICREYGWTYYEFMEQPWTFIQAVRTYLTAEAEVMRQANKK